MPHPHWPLFDLEVVTPHLTLRYITLRYIDDELGERLLGISR